MVCCHRFAALRAASNAFVICLCWLGAAPESRAQSFNVDIDAPSGPGAGVPSQTFGAVAATPGRWNALPPTGAGPFRLLLLNAVTSTVTLTRTGSASSFGQTPGSITGDHARLLGDIANIANPPGGPNLGVTHTIAGLAPGDYELITYAIAPDSSTLRSIVTVTPSPDPPATVGGALPSNTFVVNVTHAVHRFSIVDDDDTVTLNVRGGTASPGSLSGFQIKQIKPGRLFVDAAATPPGNGRAWGSAFPTVQAALDAASEMNGFAGGAGRPSIWIARGAYRPTTSADRAVSFVFPSSLDVFGSFLGVQQGLGGETSPTQRSLPVPPATPAAILSGDIGTAGTRTDNSSTVVRLTGSTPMVFDGFTIADGQNDLAPGSPSSGPAGLTIQPPSLTLSNLALLNNRSVSDGAAIAIPPGASVTLTTATITGSRARSGAIDHRGASLTIDQLWASDCAATADAGLLRAAPGSAVTISGLTAQACSAGASAGAILTDPGAGLLSVTNSRLLRCSAGSIGGAIVANAPLQLVNVLVDACSADQGAIVSADDALILNCTVIRNTALFGPVAGAWAQRGTLRVYNSILWDNDSAEIRAGEMLKQLGGGTLDARASVIQGLPADDAALNTPRDPRFRVPLGLDREPATLDDDLTPDPRGSACDSGRFDLLLDAAPAITTDVRGRPRVYDDRVAPAPFGRPIDRGAFELQCIADTSDNGTLSLQDLFDFLSRWFALDPRADTNSSGAVTIEDLFEYLSRYFLGC